MAAVTPVQATLSESRTKIVRKITLPTGGDADVAATTCVDISTFTSGITGTDCIIDRITWSLDGQAVLVFFDASSDVHALTLAPGTGVLDFRDKGGLANNAGSGKTGDIQFTTSGASATDSGFFIIEVTKVA